MWRSLLWLRPGLIGQAGLAHARSCSRTMPSPTAMGYIATCSSQHRRRTISNTSGERYLKAIESYLLVLQPIEEMERHRRRSELNIMLLPVKHNIALPDNLAEPKQVAQAAQHVLAAYDYARAQV